MHANKLGRIAGWLGVCLLATTAAWGYVIHYDDSGVYVAKWQTSPISMRLKLSTTKNLSDGNSQASTVSAAMQTWNGVLGAEQLSGQTAPVGSPTAANGVNEIGMASTVGGKAFGSGVLAVTLYYTAGDSVVEADVSINTAYTWDSYRGALRYGKEDMQRVVMHELGHVLGLDHPDEAGQSVNALMNSHESNIDTIQADDIAGAQFLYGAPGVRPANDNFAAATAINLGNGTLTLSGSNIGATRESGEPNQAASAGNHSVWWKWTAPANCNLTITTLGSNFDTVLGVYTGSSVSALTEVVSNDDEETPDQNSTPQRKRTSKVSFDANDGTTYYIAVDGWGSSSTGTAPNGYTGSITLNLLVQSRVPHVTTTASTRQFVTLGQKIDLAVSVTGSGAVSYQWFHNGAPISGATSASYSVASVATSDAGYYFVDVTDADGTTRSPPFFVLVSPVAVQLIGWGGQATGQSSVPSTVVNPIAAAAGVYHALALLPDGTVIAWGQNNYGETAVPTGLGNVVAIAAGLGYSLALKSDGTVVSWGSAPQAKAGVPTGLVNVVAISAGDYHWLALKTDGTVVSWGADNDSRIVLPNTFVGLTAVAAGHGVSLGLRTDGTVLEYPTTPYPPPTGLGKALAVAANSHLLVIDQDHTVSAWGYNSTGQASVPAGLSNVVAIAAGSQYSAAVKADGTVQTWGFFDSSHTAPPADLTDAFAVAAGASYGLVLRDASNDTVPVISTQPSALSAMENSPATFTVTATARGGLAYQWRKNGTAIAGANGANYTIAQVAPADAGSYDVVVSNHLGSVTSTSAVLTVIGPPLVVATGPYRRLIGAGQNLNLGVSASGTGPLAYQWYYNGRAIAGATAAQYAKANPTPGDAGAYWVNVTDSIGTRYGSPFFAIWKAAAPRAVGWGYDFLGEVDAPGDFTTGVAVALGWDAAMGLKADGTVEFWGNTSFLGTLPSGLTDVVAVSVGRMACMALKSDGTVVGTGEAATVPAGLKNVWSISCGASYGLALKTDGTVVGWGGQPTMPAGLTDVIAISAGAYHALAVKSDGTVVAWGQYGSGFSPTPPSGLSNVVAVAAGMSHSLALKADGTVVAWGADGDGQTSVPAGLTGVVAISTGSYHCLAQKSDGTVVAWGENIYNNSTVPPRLNGVFSMAAGGHSSMALADAGVGTVPYWGCYFGALSAGQGSWAMKVNSDNTAIYIACLTQRHSVLVVPLVIGADGSFSATGTEFVPSGQAAFPRAGALEESAADPSAPETAATASSFALSAQISFGSVSGQISGPISSYGIGFSGALDSASSQGRYFVAPNIGTAGGATYVLAGATGQALVVSTAAAVVDGAVGAVNTGGQLVCTSVNGNVYTVNFDSASASISGSITPFQANIPAIKFAGLADSAKSTAHLVNISSRADGGTANNVAIGGFVVAGTGSKRLLLRAVGPTLVGQGIAQSEVMLDPTIELHDALHGNSILATVDNWGDNPDAGDIVTTASQIGASALAGSDTTSAAALVNVPPGVYSFIARGKTNTTGIVLVEVYDADTANTDAKLVNISTRAYCATGDSVTIGGFVVAGNAPKHLLLRAVGPTLSTQGLGVNEVLADPMIEVHDALHGNTIIATNDNWDDNHDTAAIAAADSRLGATPLAAGDATSSALLITLQPGVYSFVAQGKGGTSGIVLVEVYDAD